MSTFLLILTWALGLGVLFVRPSWLPAKAAKPLLWVRAQLVELLKIP